MTEHSYSDAGCVTRIVRKDGSDVLSSLDVASSKGSSYPAIRSLGEGWFTGKPHVAGLGHVFLMRNYRAGLAKWQTADPMGYPDGWNALAYCGNGVTGSVDLFGCEIVRSDDQR